MIGDITDIFSRLKAQIPGSWFKLSPNFDATLQGPAWALSTIYSQITYAALQTRIATATDGYLDLIANDFFGTELPRLPNETDGAYRTRILANLFVKGPTRANMSAVLKLVTGRTPDIFEPSNTTDSGGLGGPSTDNVNPTGSPSIYRNDWQGNQLLYPTARTNIAQQSQTFATSSWTASNMLVTQNVAATTAPDGSGTAAKLADNDSVNSFKNIENSHNSGVSAAQTLTYSIFAKAADRSILLLRLISLGNTSNYGYAYFDLSAGTVGSMGNIGAATGITATITPVGNGWYRCRITCQPDPSATGIGFFVGAPLSVGGSTGYVGVAGNGIYIWGAQVETGAVLTSNIPTTSAAVTVTDYDLSDTGLVTLASAPVQSAVMTWSGTGTDAVTGAPVTANNQFFGNGNGYQTAFQLITPSIVDSGFYWDTGMGKWGAPMPYQSFVTAYRPVSSAQSLGELDSWRWSFDSYGTWSDSPVTAITDASIIAAVESTRMKGTVVWMRIEDNPVTP